MEARQGEDIRLGCSESRGLTIAPVYKTRPTKKYMSLTRAQALLTATCPRLLFRGRLAPNGLGEKWSVEPNFLALLISFDPDRDRPIWFRFCFLES